MIGLPTETMEDVQAIRIGEQGAQNGEINCRAIGHIHLGLHLIPKLTPFTMYPMDTPENIQIKLDLAQRGAASTPQDDLQSARSFLVESWLSVRRRIGALIMQVGGMVPNSTPGLSISTCRLGRMLFRADLIGFLTLRQPRSTRPSLGYISTV